MNIVIVSAFRNMSGRVHRYMSQVHELQIHAEKDSPYHVIRVSAITGDNTDNTEEELVSVAKLFDVPITVTHYETNKPLYPSIEHAERLDALTDVMVGMMGSVNTQASKSKKMLVDDVVLYIESDLLWEPHQVGSIIDMAYRREQGFDIIAPMIFAGDLFYDTFVFRKDGARFSPHRPYTHDVSPSGITEVDSVGSCLAFRAELAKKVTPIGREGLISWCNGARSQGYRVGVAANFRVNHP